MVALGPGSLLVLVGIILKIIIVNLYWAFYDNKYVKLKANKDSA